MPKMKPAYTELKQEESPAGRHRSVAGPQQRAGLCLSSPVQRGCSAAVASDDDEATTAFVSREEHEAALAAKAKAEALAEALAENATLRQVVRSAKAVTSDDERMRVLSAADVPDEEDQALVAGGGGSANGGTPRAPTDRTLRQTVSGTNICGGLYFTPDAQTLVHGGFLDKELSLWDLRSGTRTRGNGAVKRSGSVYTSAVSPDGQRLCIAAHDGLAMYQLTPRRSRGGGSSEGGSGGARCELLWEIGAGTRFAGVAFSRDGALIAAARWETGELEIRDAGSNSTLRAMDDFPAVQYDSGLNCIAWSEEVLAVGGREGKPNQRQVRLYSVKQDFEVLTTLEVPGRKAHSLAMSPDGTKLAVAMDGFGGNWGDLVIFSSADDWGDPPLILVNPQPQPGTQWCCSTAFSPDGRYLCAGYCPSNQYVLWDVEAAVCVRALPTKEHHACAFSPAGDLLATGGNQGNPVVVHELLPPGPLATFALPGEAEQPISAACASDRLVVLASGKRLAALRRPDGQVLWQTDLEEAAFAYFGTMALPPAGDQVAICMHKAKIVSVRETMTGNEVYALTGINSLHLVRYSPDGSLLLVVSRSPECTKVYDAANGTELHSFEGKGGYEGGIDPSNTVLVMTGPPGTSTIVSLESGDEVLALDPEGKHHMHGGVFNDAGDRMVYGLDDEHGGVPAILCEKVDGTWRETQRWDRPDGLEWAAHTEWSPGDGRYLLIVSCGDKSGDAGGRGRIHLLDTETGKEPAWSRCFRAMMLPPGILKLHTEGDTGNMANPSVSVQWVRQARTQAQGTDSVHHRDHAQIFSREARDAAKALKQALRNHRAWPEELQQWLRDTEQYQGVPHLIRTMVTHHSRVGEHRLMSGATEAVQAETVKLLESCAEELEAIIKDPDGQEPDLPVLHQPLILQAAIGSKLYLIDVAAFIHTFEEDGNFSLEQLNRLSDSDPDLIPVLLEKWPHIVNFRGDTAEGDTVLHYCARTGKPEAAQQWLSGSVPPPLLENHDGRSALREAVNHLHFGTVETMIGRLDPNTPLSRTHILTDDIVAIAEAFPRDVVRFIELLESTDVDDAQGGSRFNLFRKQEKLTLLNKPLDTKHGYAVRASADGAADEPWPEFVGDDAQVKCECELLVLAIAGFAGMPTDREAAPPYTKLYQACGDVSEDLLNKLMMTHLMSTVTKFKWDAYCKRRVYKRLSCYVLHFALAASAMLMSTQFAELNAEFHSNSGWTGHWTTVDAAMACDILQGALVLTNSVVAYRELNQVKLTLMDMRRRDPDHPPSCWSAVWRYLSSAWNMIDLAGILALYAAAVAHLIDNEAVLQRVGSLGVLLNAFSFLQLLTPFESTGPLIKTILEIISDIVGYCYVLLVLLWGFSVSFAVAMPNNRAFMDGKSGPLVGLLTSFEAIVGSFDMNDFENLESTLLFIGFMALMVIIMLNLLIAIMSDSYEKVKESEVVEARKLRAETIIAEEKLMNDKDRADSNYFPRYLQVLRATDGTEQKWAGLSGKMVSEIMKVEDKLDQTERGLKQQVEQMSDKVNEQIEQVKKQVAQLKGQMMEEMQEMKTEIINALKAELTKSRAGPVPEQRFQPEPEPEVERDV